LFTSWSRDRIALQLLVGGWGDGAGVVLAYLYVLSSMYVSWGGGKRWVGVGGGGCVLSGKGTAA